MKNIKICVLVKNHTKNSAHGGSNLRKMTFSKSIFSGIYSMRLDLIIYNEFMGHCLKALQANFIYLLPFRIYWVSILKKIAIFEDFHDFQPIIVQYQMDWNPSILIFQTPYQLVSLIIPKECPSHFSLLGNRHPNLKKMLIFFVKIRIFAKFRRPLWCFEFLGRNAFDNFGHTASLSVQ